MRRIEVGDIFQAYGDQYRARYGATMPEMQRQAMGAIEQCRTAFLGGHIDACDDCGRERNSYNSCRNRHCPKCQSIPTERWLRDRLGELLPVHYFHLVFTLPDTLNDLMYGNPRLLYAVLFDAASETILTLAGNTIRGSRQRVYLGARVGLTTILHTWGQNLSYHPHLHVLATGGGMSADGQRWIVSRPDYFIPAPVLSAIFKGKFLDKLRRRFQRLQFNHHTRPLADKTVFDAFTASLRDRDWVVYCKEPPANARPERIVKYFGRYTHKVAIANSRIIKLENDRVHFRWKDYRDHDRIKPMSLPAMEFIRRFLLHVLPHRFMKIRYYGLLNNSQRKKNLIVCRKLLGVTPVTTTKSKESATAIVFELTGVDITVCPYCKKGHMRRRATLLPVRTAGPVRNHSPPLAGINV